MPGEALLPVLLPQLALWPLPAPYSPQGLSPALSCPVRVGDAVQWGNPVLGTCCSLWPPPPCASNAISHCPMLSLVYWNGPLLALGGLEKRAVLQSISLLALSLMVTVSSVQLWALNMMQLPRGQSTGALRQEPVCLVQTDGVTHQVVQVMFSRLLV